MRRHLLSATSLATTLLFLVPGLALAQAAPKDWTGPYVGFGVGGVSATDSIDFAFSSSSGGAPASINVPVLGPSGTITGGYDKQSGSFVYGIAADGSLLLASGSASATSTSAQSSLDALLSVRARLGLTTGNLLAFATAGITGGYENFYTKLTSTGGPDTITGARGAGIVVGPTVGLGVEYGLTDKISLTAEGSVAELGSLTATGDNGKGPYTATNHTTVVGVKSGLNFRF